MSKKNKKQDPLANYPNTRKILIKKIREAIRKDLANMNEKEQEKLKKENDELILKAGKKFEKYFNKAKKKK